MNSTQIAQICKALGDANRLQIVQMLQDGEMCACRLLEAFDITQPTLSHHMRVLCDCGLVCVRREGKWSHYSLCCETFSAFKDFIGKLECCKNEKGGCDCG
jgi:ArsR family transcriptional regulator